MPSRVERLSNNRNPHIRNAALKKWEENGAIGGIETARKETPALSEIKPSGQISIIELANQWLNALSTNLKL